MMTYVRRSTSSLAAAAFSTTSFLHERPAAGPRLVVVADAAADGCCLGLGPAADGHRLIGSMLVFLLPLFLLLLLLPLLLALAARTQQAQSMCGACVRACVAWGPPKHLSRAGQATCVCRVCKGGRQSQRDGWRASAQACRRIWGLRHGAACRGRMCGRSKVRSLIISQGL